MHSLHNTHKTNAYMADHSCVFVCSNVLTQQLLAKSEKKLIWTLCQCKPPHLILFNFLQSVLTTWQTHKFVSGIDKVKQCVKTSFGIQLCYKLMLSNFMAVTEGHSCYMAFGMLGKCNKSTNLIQRVLLHVEQYKHGNGSNH
jgi:hypothetical protein